MILSRPALSNGSSSSCLSTGPFLAGRGVGVGVASLSVPANADSGMAPPAGSLDINFSMR